MRPFGDLFNLHPSSSHAARVVAQTRRRPTGRSGTRARRCPGAGTGRNGSSGSIESRLAATPRAEWPDDPDWCRSALDDWDDRFGDRRQELVFIGSDLDREALEAVLVACLLTEDEAALGESAWGELDDPFAAWMGDSSDEGDDPAG